MSNIDIDKYVLFRRLDIEDMDIEELQARSAVEVGMALNDITIAIVEVTRLLQGARKKRSEAKIAKAARKDGAEEQYEISRLIVDIVSDRARMLREIKSAQQSLVRAIP